MASRRPRPPWHFVLATISILITTPAFSGETIGWRTDATGRYPSAQPPHEWGPDKNVIWRLPMPAMSNAIPVIVGDKLFTCADPCRLICANKADGKILWQRECSYDELPLFAEVKQQCETEQKQAQAWDRMRGGIERDMATLSRSARYLKLSRQSSEPLMQVLRKVTEELRNKVNTLPVYSRYSKPYMQQTGGISMCTPACDGKCVYVGYGNGLVAGYDMEGNRQWLKLIEHSTAAYGHAASPLLVGDRLLVHYADLVALDTRDGSEVWRDKIPPKHGTSIHTRIGGVDVAIHPGGLLVRVDDGKILTNNLGQNGENSPIIQDGIVYWIAGSGRAVRLPKSVDERPETLWKDNIKGGGYWFCSPVLHEGLIYVANANKNFSVIDAATGKLVYEMRLDVDGQIYPSICVAGNLIYLSSDDGTTIILKPGREYQEVGRNKLDTFRSSPVFEGKRMYVRTVKYLYCIGE
jgi:outer membrane protein assembly factor BamB